MISPEHEQKILVPRGLTAEQAAVYGVRSILTEDELPEELRESKYATVPGLLFIWHSPIVGDVLQYRPDDPVFNPDGDPVKYLFPGGTSMVLNKLRDTGDGPLLLQEGTLQSIAAATYTHPGWSVYGMSGCWSWRKGDTTVAIPDLLVAEGRDVVVSLDADAATNLDVYNAGIALQAALMAEGAHTVTFLRLDGHGRKAGLDDVLGARPADRRASYLQRLLEHAEEKPAKKAPPKKARSSSSGPILATTADRPMVVVNGDRFEVINALTDALRTRWSGTELFNYGGIIARRIGTEVAPVTKGLFADLVAEATLCVTVNSKGEPSPAWPDDKSCDATLSRADRFSPLQRIARVPFVRGDGSICQTQGYDTATETFVVLDERVADVEVPEEPTEDDIASAVKLLTEEWLGDLFSIMPTDEDRANAMALMLTPFIRGLVPLAPMAVVDGLQMGVGKNLLADLLSILAYTGRPAQPLLYSREDEENRKVITSMFRSGQELIVFDEAHVIEGRALTKALTGITYSDRILGVSNMIEFPNRMTWVALGNNVSVVSDLARRVYRIRLAPTAENPQDRDVSSFRHPDIKRWTMEHRHELVAAALTLVRAWFVSAPEGERRESAAGRRFGSFEQWGGMVGGILDHAGIEGFLGSLVEWRSETDFETQWWLAHLSWLQQQFGEADFTTSDVVQKMKRATAGTVEHPPRLEDHDARGYNRSLGLAYGRVKNRYMRGLRLVKTVDSPGHGNRWAIVDTSNGTTSGSSPATDSSDSQGSDESRGDRVEAQPATRKKISTQGVYVHTYSVNSQGPGDSATTDTTVSIAPPYPLYPSYPADVPGGGDPMALLLPLLPPVPARECPDCDRIEELTAGGLWYACRSCTPGSFE